MKFSICSFAFHRGLLCGEIGFHRYLDLSRELGATHLHFWLPHCVQNPPLRELQRWDWRPDDPTIPSWMEAPSDDGWIEDVRNAIAATGLRIEMLAMEKGYAWSPSKESRRAHRRHFLQWLTFAGRVGIPALRIDPGSERDPSPETIRSVIRGYREAQAMAADHAVRLFVENHWGASQQAGFLEALLNAVPGLGLLLDTWNFGTSLERAEGWERLHHRAEAVHVKTLAPDALGHDTTYPVVDAVRRLAASGYDGVWGIESFCPDTHCDEIEAVRRTRTLICRTVDETVASSPSGHASSRP